MQTHFPNIDLNRLAEMARDLRRSFGRSGGGGDPDLFVFNPKTGERFFVEAKDKDELHANQHLCFQVIERHLCPVKVARIVAHTS